ncbi:MAG TPA: mannose-6-phosphate isomerase [Clostridiales bacterium]|nr:mannose-6-phosphate isomerase [Clostridiales bacterium]
MPAYRLTPSLHTTPWGGDRLRTYGKDPAVPTLGESWELSFVPGAESRLDDGRKISDAFGKEAYGTRAADMPFFPVLTKFIDAARDLSVQVHPSDAYALAHEGQYGKCEMWYILDAAKDAGIYLGLSEKTDAETLRHAALDGTAQHLLRFFPVKAGESYLIPPGTIHAIGAGVVLFEIQENSTLTYRLYDYGRPGTDGKPRELHLEKALAVATLDRYTKAENSSSDPTLIGLTPYFETHVYKLNFTKRELFVDKTSFLSLTVTEGEGRIDGQISKKGDTFFLPANSGRVTAEGKMTLVAVSLPEREKTEAPS